MLSRPFLHDIRRLELWPLVREEVAAFWRTDVPKFTARGDSDSLVLPSGETARACFTDSAVNQSQQNLLHLGEDDLCWQVKLIRGSMDARDAKSFTWYAPPAEYDDEQMEPLDRAQLVDQAVALGRGLERAAIRQANGEPGWLVLKSLPQGDEFALRAMELDLYNGRSGVALFFAALQKVAPGLGFGESARGALAIVRRWLVKADDRGIASLGGGGLLGFPSVAYALARVGVLLDDAGLIEEAVGAARRIGPDLVNGDKAFDVLGGGAGAILCLTRKCGDPKRVSGGPPVLGGVGEVVVQMTSTVLITAPIMCVGGVVMSIHQDVGLSWLLVVSVLVLTVASYLMISRMLPLFHRLQSLIDNINRVMREQLSGIKVIRAFARERFEQRRFTKANRDVFVTALAVGRWQVLMAPVTMLMINLSSVALTWFGGLRIEAGQMQVGSLIAFLSYFLLILMSVLILMEFLELLPRASVCAGRLGELLSTAPAITSPLDLKRPAYGIEGVVRLDRVTFRYPGADRAALRNVSLTASPGTVTAIIG
ncbi:ABC transporter transmembrane domain-containing protein [Mycobacterium pseudokansasii]|uniref:Putative ABC transporter ATP-binding protein n=1 Tax=Mycobacterium pseudokansasii TaxID=2341080 RepID=A0A498QQ07_9MYCO|nr:ABC transporter transmembrane domain-containing protein [Mycobacterium pseudokansasii]VAZ92376.1 putative ABC transporter ATP-binding protein [Mycobacterium pseudokansasii]VAZ93480.1 putative ABC transporter ATP-binding protein [Mycobacterium pseudokansasii]VBA49345.1 putative ABC transporter ATP-binding protein [Mycobacterium pseudokansasii]